jgi:hypothetical protein
MTQQGITIGDGLRGLDDLDPFVEVWTRNTVYVLDRALRCVALVDRTTHERVEAPPVGASLACGAAPDGRVGATTTSWPLPSAGSVALFVDLKRPAHVVAKTSRVERVVIHVRGGVTREEAEAAAWSMHRAEV